MIKMPKRGLLKNIGRRLSLRLVLAVIALVLAPAAAGAKTLVSQSYASDSNLPSGSIVSLQKGYSDRVTGATIKNDNDIFGVVVNPDSSQLSISSGQSNQVNVSQSGLEQVLVSDINGDIDIGDSITASPITGVGMKATENSKVIGVAQDSFPNSTAQNTTYKDGKGQQQTVKLGQIPVLVSVAYYYKQPDKTIIPQALQNLANSIAGKKVNSLPIIISAVIFIVTLVIVVSIVYSLIHSSIISVGRNPMSQSAIYRNVIQLSVLVIVILGVAVGSIYMVLTKF
jgi:hypothetical protein